MTAVTNSFDLVVFSAINGAGPPWLVWVFSFFSSPRAAVLGAAVVAGLLLVKYRADVARTAVMAAAAVGLSDSVGFHLLKPLIGRVRPCYALPSGSVHILAHAANVGSMPSLHAANSFAAAFVLTALDRRLALIAYPVAVMVSLSRVYLGVHWPTDILGGAVWGTLAGALAWWAVLAAGSGLSRWRARQAPPVGK